MGKSIWSRSVWLLFLYDNWFPWNSCIYRSNFPFIFARKVFRGDFDTGKGYFTTMKSDYVAIEILGLYWHFVDLVWVFFSLFYLW